jgi:hypothetical protein
VKEDAVDEPTQLDRIETQLAGIARFNDTMVKIALKGILFYLFLSLPWGAFLRSLLESR